MDNTQSLNARSYWEQANRALEAIGRKMDRAEKRAESASMGVAYDALCEEIELLRVQYVAVRELRDQRWARFWDITQAGLTAESTQ